jgi:hypothetical protein
MELSACVGECRQCFDGSECVSCEVAEDTPGPGCAARLRRVRRGDAELGGKMHEMKKSVRVVPEMLNSCGPEGCVRSEAVVRQYESLRLSV